MVVKPEIRRYLRLGAAGALSIASASAFACGGTEKIAGIAPVATVSVVIASPSLAVGAKTQATATLRDDGGSVVHGRTVTWSSTDETVASVSSTGEVTALRVGTAEIRATSEGQIGSAVLSVAPAPIHSVTVVLANAQIGIGATTQASAVAKDASGNDLTGRPIVWSTSNPEVATVSEQGIVTGVKAGTADIIASGEGKTGSASLTVLAGSSVAQVSVSLPQPGLAVGFSIPASSVLKDADGDVLTGRSVTWSSSNTAVATVSQAGVVTGVGRGDAEISATIDGKTGAATIGVVVIRPQSLSVGNGHTCAIAVDGDTYCWGLNTHGQLGGGFISQSSPTPVRVVGGIKFAAVSAGFVVTYALAENGQMYCWGDCESGGTRVSTPRPWSTARPAEVVDANDSGSSSGVACLFRVGETAWCWGGNLHGQLGRGTRGEALVAYPEGPVAGNLAFADIATGNGQHACAITTAGIGYCWGGGKSGERGALGAGAGAAKESLVPQVVSGNHVFKDISVTELHTCAVTTAGHAYCWGDNNRGQLGAPTEACPWPNSLSDTCSAVPVAVTGGHVFESISVGGQASCGLTTDGEIYCWGAGYGETTTPVPAGGGVRFRSISSSFCAISTDGLAYCRSGGTTAPVSGELRFRAP